MNLSPKHYVGFYGCIRTNLKVDRKNVLSLINGIKLITACHDEYKLGRRKRTHIYTWILTPRLSAACSKDKQIYKTLIYTGELIRANIWHQIKTKGRPTYTHTRETRWNKTAINTYYNTQRRK